MKVAFWSLLLHHIDCKIKWLAVQNNQLQKRGLLKQYLKEKIILKSTKFDQNALRF